MVTQSHSGNRCIIIVASLQLFVVFINRRRVVFIHRTALQAIQLGTENCELDLRNCRCLVRSLNRFQNYSIREMEHKCASVFGGTVHVSHKLRLAGQQHGHNLTATARKQQWALFIPFFSLLLHFAIFLRIALPSVLYLYLVM